MALESPGRPSNVIGPAGKPLSIDDLPPPDTERWVIRRKAEVVAAVRAGLITLEEACERYRLSVEEFLSWQRLIDKHGMRGLRTTVEPSSAWDAMVPAPPVLACRSSTSPDRMVCR